MEQSSALKCPSVGYQLTGTKRVQQVLTQPGVLELFLDEKSSDQLRKSFAGQYSLGSLVTPEGEKAVMDGTWCLSVYISLCFCFCLKILVYVFISLYIFLFVYIFPISL
mgnify:FL=1